MRLATLGDVPLILRWRQDAANWLSTIGSDQWNDAGLTADSFADRVAKSIHEGGTWIAEDDDGNPVGTIAIDCRADDTGLWTDDELQSSVMVHRMIVDIGARGKGIGAEMLRHAAVMARQLNKSQLALDAWSSNTGLHDYYVHQGFRHLRTVEGHYNPSSALFVKAFS
jgi:GNAT superfamily N-acetyltransferase